MLSSLVAIDQSLFQYPCSSLRQKFPGFGKVDRQPDETCYAFLLNDHVGFVGVRRSLYTLFYELLPPCSSTYFPCAILIYQSSSSSVDNHQVLLLPSASFTRPSLASAPLTPSHFPLQMELLQPPALYLSQHYIVYQPRT